MLFHYRERALFHLSADHGVLRCAISERGTAWQRVLLDTVFWTISLLQGFELLHAGAVVTSQGLIALVGAGVVLTELGPGWLVLNVVGNIVHATSVETVSMPGPRQEIQAAP